MQLTNRCLDGKPTEHCYKPKLEVESYVQDSYLIVFFQLLRQYQLDYHQLKLMEIRAT
ncbi:hypothetical protein [Nostoc sp. 106C]|uniref:hypothetical protein n=1 Tax=Nostoc sp. 106C TaxID=1932667 RepID=UPI001FB61E4A|nr:hypothetical protein [Nostoc sp. 106C]